MHNKLIWNGCKGPPLHVPPLELYSFGNVVGTTDVIGLYVRDRLIRATSVTMLGSVDYVPPVVEESMCIQQTGTILAWHHTTYNIK